MNNNKDAIYFSRSVIPFIRDKKSLEKYTANNDEVKSIETIKKLIDEIVKKLDIKETLNITDEIKKNKFLKEKSELINKITNTLELSNEILDQKQKPENINDSLIISEKIEETKRKNDDYEKAEKERRAKDAINRLLEQGMQLINEKCESNTVQGTEKEEETC